MSNWQVIIFGMKKLNSEKQKLILHIGLKLFIIYFQLQVVKNII
jgi:hypothetical protein